MPDSYNAPHRNPILVTGAHRTGTTWVGKMLTASREAAYISEPLNVLHRPGVMNVPVEYWYIYICAENGDDYLPGLCDTLRFRYHTWSELRSLRSRKDLLRMGRDWCIFTQGRLRRQQPLLKDPFAVFSLPWFAEQLGCQIVVTIRHPAAFASSLKRLNWPFDFNNLLSQPLLMRDWLEPFRSKMESFVQHPDDIIGQASLLWCMVYQVVEVYRKRLPGIYIVRHEDISFDPVQGFRSLYASLGLHFDPGVEDTILNSSSPENPKELSHKKVHSVRLDSQANLHNWKRRLDTQEIARIRQLTEDIAAQYYPGLEWE